MTAARWLTERQPAPPAELSAAVAGALSRSVSGAGAYVAGDDVPSQLLGAVQDLLPRVASAECEQRSGALDLLALDALITYAMEAASGSAAECEATATSLLSMIAGAARKQ